MPRSFPLAIATIVRGRDATEQELENRTVASLAQLGFPVCIASIRPVEYNAVLEQGLTRVIRLDPGSNTGDQLRAAFHAATTAADLVLYLAGDKAYFSAYLSAHMQRVLGTIPANCAMLNFGRTPRAFATFPACQRLTETAINYAVTAYTGNVFDIAYGAYIFHRAIVEGITWTAGFAGLQPLGWLVGKACASGRPITQIEDDFRCPESQRTETGVSSRRYRITQCAQFLEGFAAGLA